MDQSLKHAEAVRSDMRSCIRLHSGGPKADRHSSRRTNTVSLALRACKIVWRLHQTRAVLHFATRRLESVELEVVKRQAKLKAARGGKLLTMSRCLARKD
ncbi:hypothetical protein ZHAS_00008958 [Anopheles sinensis]|uniref:Uncharacterized protein n=1 Tax=Anopheles sinensis TaxID=74873 RepID=A0A084VTT2_ANOSI|nr:hypothetical protein ZHAS_00008958 [Anopheles sinensis]